MQLANYIYGDNLNKKQPTCLSVHYNVMHNMCQVICVSKNKKMLLIGSEKDLFIMNFVQCNGQFKQLNKLRGHRDLINSIQIINSDLEIITAGSEGLINIWKKDQQWKLYQSLDNQKNYDHSIIVNKSENLIISQLGRDIKFWIKQYDYWQCIQQIEPFKGRLIHHLVLNDKSDTLVAANSSICIIKLQSNSIWKITQNLNVLDGNHLYKLCFLKNDQFAIFPFLTKDIKFYQQDQNQLFNQIKKITVQTSLFDSYFASKYLNNGNLIITIGDAIHFLQIDNNYDIIQQYQIKNDFFSSKKLIIEDMYLLINYYYIQKDNQERKIFKIQNYKNFINLK